MSFIEGFAVAAFGVLVGIGLGAYKIDIERFFMFFFRKCDVVITAPASADKDYSHKMPNEERYI